MLDQCHLIVSKSQGYSNTDKARDFTVKNNRGIRIIEIDSQLCLKEGTIAVVVTVTDSRIYRSTLSEH